MSVVDIINVKIDFVENDYIWIMTVINNYFGVNIILIIIFVNLIVFILKNNFYIIHLWGLGIGDWGLGPIPNPQSPYYQTIKLII